jgi:tyrosine-protein phosphatase MSG5
VKLDPARGGDLRGAEDDKHRTTSKLLAKMPSATARRMYEDQLPSFMSVFDLDADAIGEQGPVTVVDPKIMVMDPHCDAKLAASHPLQPAASLPSDPSHRHHDSTSTQNSESADSSPTTTVSCTDSSSLSDPSPSSSPDSPINLVPLSSFPGPSFGGLSSMAALTVADGNVERPMTSPSPRRPRNMKGLSIQPPGSSTSTLVSEPSSPSFIKPTIPAMKRKPSQLSLKTSTSDLIKGTTIEVPQSPSLPPILQRRALKHSTSSPHMLSGFKSATFGPAGGMTFPTVLERNESGLSEYLRPSKPVALAVIDSAITEEESSPIRPQMANRTAFDVEPFHEHENNEDQKTPGYPDGPIAIYSDNVFLYLEPTAEEASRFDVVINVAREVRNPFQRLAASRLEKSSVSQESSDTVMSDAPPAGSAQSIPVPEHSFDDATPTTPKATFAVKEPEYIHMPWDHNTDIGHDLMTLCETIEARTKEGKKVLVHCQQGASRSASLIIAYGIYQNPELSVHDAYVAAQSRSKWISPNMRLMYCLQDFHKEMGKRKLTPNSAFKPRSSGRSPSKHRMTLSVDAIDIPAKEPRTAPLPGEEDTIMGTSSPDMGPLRARGNSTPNSRGGISPGPSSAPSTFSWSEKEDEKDPHKFGRFPRESLFQPSQPDSGFVSSSSLGSMAKPPPSPGFGSHRFGGFGRFPPAPLSFGSVSSDEGNGGYMPIERHITVMQGFPDDAALMSPRAETMTSNPLHAPLSDIAGMRFVEVPPTPSDGLFSPRQTMFPRDPFFPFGRPTEVTDPRSPPTKGETPIVRSIDEML